MMTVLLVSVLLKLRSMLPGKWDTVYGFHMCFHNSIVTALNWWEADVKIQGS